MPYPAGVRAPRHLHLPLALVGCLVLVGCSTSPDGWPDPPEDRPVVDLAFHLAEDLSTAQGTETLAFTPSTEVCELVFRAWPNKPATAATGNSLTVEEARVDGRPVAIQTESAGAPPGRPGTLLSLPLDQCSPGGELIRVELEFTVALGVGTDERIGYAPAQEVAWLGTAYPLLAWDGAGWTRDPAVNVVGESVTSSTFRLRSLLVTAPADYQVAGVGTAEGSTVLANGLTEHRFSAPAVRDVTITVGDIELTRAALEGVEVTVAVPAQGSRASAGEWLREVDKALEGLVEPFGPLPYDHLWISVLPGVTDGVEYSGAVQFGDVRPQRQQWLVVHELAHQWFYGLVGNNQATDPWLDESLASYAERVVEGGDHVGDVYPKGVLGALGDGMTQWAQRRDADSAYVDTVYIDGARTLLRAREVAGTERFDAALRQYLRDNAHEVAEPADLANALVASPEALEVLADSGALDGVTHSQE